jgi:serine protease Do
MSAAVALVFLVLGGAAAAQSEAERRTPVVRAVERAAPAVVGISTTKIVRSDPIFDAWLGTFGGTRRVKSVGSGVIVHPDGYLVTNYHVVRRAREILVVLEENGEEKQYEGMLLAEDARNDLALVKIRASRRFTPVRLGRSDDLMIGEPVIAVGNPFGVGKTVTTGVVSAVNRTVRLPDQRGSAWGVNEFEDFIQTDAAINPGNSGGPLLNIKGEMIGVNEAIRQGSEGLGFAIPADRVKAILRRLIDAAVQRANLGFLPVKEKAGVTVRSVRKGSAAEKGGLRSGDVIVKVDGAAVPTVFDFTTPLLTKKPGDTIRIAIHRKGERKQIDLKVPLTPEAQYVADRLGVLGVDLSPADRVRGHYGVLVDKVLEGTPAQRVSMKPGDLITEVRFGLRSLDVKNLKVLAGIVNRYEGLTVEIVVWRKGHERPLVGALKLASPGSGSPR